MRKILAILCFALLLLSFTFTSVFALNINKDVYPQAFSTKDYPIKGQRLYEYVPYDYEASGYPFDRIIAGPVVNDGPMVHIDRIMVNYPADDQLVKEYLQERLQHDFTINGSSSKIAGEAIISAENRIQIVSESWEDVVARRTTIGLVHQETTLHGQPALVREIGSRTFKENPKEFYRSSYELDVYVLIDDTNLVSTFMYHYNVNLEYRITGGGMGEGYAEQWEIYYQMEEDWWNNVLLAKFDEFLAEVTDVSFDIKRTRLYEGEIGKELVPAETESDDKNVSDEIDTDASHTQGETGVTIPEAVIIAILATSAAAAAVAAGSGGSGNDSSEEKKENTSTYRMLLRKDFGDAIRIGAAPVTVYARIVEISANKEEIDRPDLTAMINITGKRFLQVDDCRLVDNYMGALVYAADKDNTAKPDTGEIAIRFSGNQGSFTNNVTFRIIGKPYLEFLKRGDYLDMTINMLYGDNETYTTQFIPKDFIEPPTKINLTLADNAMFIAEYEKTDTERYQLKVKNQSIKPDRLIIEKLDSFVRIKAENEKEQAETIVRVNIFPEGLSIANTSIKEDKFEVMTFNEDTSDEQASIKPTRFNLRLVVKEKDEKGFKIIEVKADKFNPNFSDLKGLDQRTINLAEKFKYEIVPVESNLKRYDFKPLNTLVEDLDKPYWLTLPIDCDYNGESYSLDLPMRLLGTGPGPLEERAAELAKMRRIINNVGGISTKVAMQLRKNGSKLSAAELRLINKQICEEAIDYYTKDANELIKTANKLENLEYWADWIKWLGDQAFSYLMTIYAGNGEIILTPAKEMTVEFIAELLADVIDGQELASMDFLSRVEKLNAIKKIDGMIENLLMAVATGENVSIKKAASCLAGWFVYKVAKNIQDNIEQTGNYHVFDAIMGAGKDLTVEAMKKAGMKQFEKLMKNKSVQDKFEKWFGSFVGKHLKNNYELFYDEKNLLQIKDIATRSEALKKLMEGLMGEGINWTFNQFKQAPDPKAGKQVESYERVSLTGDGKIKLILITPNEKTGEGFVAELDIIASFTGLFNLFFKATFGFVPFETDTKQIPNDPILYKN